MNSKSDSNIWIFVVVILFFIGIIFSSIGYSYSKDTCRGDFMNTKQINKIYLIPGMIEKTINISDLDLYNNSIKIMTIDFPFCNYSDLNVNITQNNILIYTLIDNLNKTIYLTNNKSIDIISNKNVIFSLESVYYNCGIKGICTSFFAIIILCSVLFVLILCRLCIINLYLYIKYKYYKKSQQPFEFNYFI